MKSHRMHTVSQSSLAGPRQPSLLRLRGISLGLAVFGFAVLGLMPARSDDASGSNSPVSVLLYDTQGDYVGIYTYLAGGLYDADGIEEDTVPDFQQGQVYDLNGHWAGYITVPSP